MKGQLIYYPVSNILILLLNLKTGVKLYGRTKILPDYKNSLPYIYTDTSLDFKFIK